MNDANESIELLESLNSKKDEIVSSDTKKTENNVSEDSTDKLECKKQTKSKNLNKVIGYPTSIPQWSSKVLSIIKNGELLLKYKPFVNEAAYFLMSIKDEMGMDSKILPSEYSNFAMTLCNEYTDLEKLPSDHDKPYVSIIVGNFYLIFFFLLKSIIKVIF